MLGGDTVPVKRWRLKRRGKKPSSSNVMLSSYKKFQLVRKNKSELNNDVKSYYIPKEKAFLTTSLVGLQLLTKSWRVTEV